MILGGAGAGATGVASSVGGGAAGGGQMMQMMQKLGPMLMQQGGEDKVAQQLAPLGPPPQVPGAQPLGETTGNVLAQYQQQLKSGPGGMRRPVLRAPMMTRGEMLTNPGAGSVGSTLAGRY